MENEVADFVLSRGGTITAEEVEKAGRCILSVALNEWLEETKIGISGMELMCLTLDTERDMGIAIAWTKRARRMVSEVGNILEAAQTPARLGCHQRRRTDKNRLTIAKK